MRRLIAVATHRGRRRTRHVSHTESRFFSMTWRPTFICYGTVVGRIRRCDSSRTLAPRGHTLPRLAMVASHRLRDPVRAGGAGRGARWRRCAEQMAEPIGLDTAAAFRPSYRPEKGPCLGLDPDMKRMGLVAAGIGGVLALLAGGSLADAPGPSRRAGDRGRSQARCASNPIIPAACRFPAPIWAAGLDHRQGPHLAPAAEQPELCPTLHAADAQRAEAHSPGRQPKTRCSPCKAGTGQPPQMAEAGRSDSFAPETRGRRGAHRTRLRHRAGARHTARS